MIAAALEAEVEEYVASFVDEVDEDGKRLVVRNGRARERRLTIGSGTVPIRARRVNDKRILALLRWFAVGWVVAIVAWGLHVGALSLAPLSIVQAVLSGGLVFLAVFAERYFGFHLGRRQRNGVTITAAGLVVIGLTGGGATRPRRASLAALIAVEGAVFATGAALVRISARRLVLRRAEGLLLGAAASALSLGEHDRARRR